MKSAQSQQLFPRQLPAHLTAAPVSAPSPCFSNTTAQFKGRHQKTSLPFSRLQPCLLAFGAFTGFPHAQEDPALLKLTWCHFLFSGCFYHLGYLLLLCAQSFPDTNACPVCLQYSVPFHRLLFSSIGFSLHISLLSQGFLQTPSEHSSLKAVVEILQTLMCDQSHRISYHMLH